MKFVSQINSAGQSLTEISERMLALSRRAYEIDNKINGCYGCGGVYGMTSNIAADMKSQAEKIEHLGTVAVRAYQLYTQSEEVLISKSTSASKVIYSSLDVPYPTAYAGVVSSSGDVLNKIGEAVMFAAPIAVGVPLIASKYLIPAVAESTSYWVNNYKKKGWTYKLLQTGKAALKIAKSAVGCAATWATAPTGVGVPLAVLSTIYTVNDVTSGVSDIVNIWQGDFDEVGQVNMLQDAIVGITGEVGEMLGSQEAGEIVGEMIYDAGKIVKDYTDIKGIAGVVTKTPSSMVGKVIQNDTNLGTFSDAAKEIPNAVKGAIDIAINSPLRNVKKDVALLRYTVPNLMQVASTGKLLEDVGDMTKDVLETGFKYFNKINKIL